MNYRTIIFCLAINSATQLHTEGEHQISRVIIHNNHKITQTVTSNSNEYDTPNRYPGHTKSDTTTHRVDITPMNNQTKTDQSTTAVDNTHTISQTATHATINRRSTDPLLPGEVKPTGNTHSYAPWDSNSSWIGAFIPPIIAQSPAIQYFLGAVGLSYAALVAKLVHTSYFVLPRTDTWSVWQANVSIEAMGTHEKQFAQELFTALQNKYIHAPVNACFLSPLVHFINDVDAELSQLITFISLHKTIDKFNLTFMFPKQENELQLAREKIKRLEYFKTIIINWVGEYKA
jgi:hypothetical protein